MMNADVTALTFAAGAGRDTPESALVARVPIGLAGAGGSWFTLLETLAEQLQFPAYFGYSVSALWDCLCDLHWVTQHKVVIIHEELPPGIPVEGLRTYLRLLIDAVLEWQSERAARHACEFGQPLHELEVIFPVEWRWQIERLLQTDAPWHLSI